MRGLTAQPVLAGFVGSLVGFASSFTVVLAGLRAVGATEAQAASGLGVLCFTMGAASIALGLRYRIPISIAWSTPGAALLASASVPHGGFAAAVGAFLVCGLLLALAGLWRPLGRVIAAIPVPIASAMLAGVLLPLCLAPVRAVAELPELAAPVVVTWALLSRFARRWAVPAALVVAAAAIALREPVALGPVSGLVPSLSLTAPAFDGGALIGLALPLFLVTMASQNVPGMGVLASFGYRPDLRPILLTTGAASAAGAPFGAHAINLAAITAALMAGPDAHPDPARRWIATVTGGAFYLVLALVAAAATAFIAASPPLLIEAVAGLALLGALGGALTTAMEDAGHREAAVITFVVAASGIAPLGVSAAFWALLAGLAFDGLVGRAGAAPTAARNR
ncbi:MAG TPA: benzoate/H(+) symporter BenE family transporter [Solirubrobacteraceae bacterium]